MDQLSFNDSSTHSMSLARHQMQAKRFASERDDMSTSLSASLTPVPPSHTRTTPSVRVFPPSSTDVASSSNLKQMSAYESSLVIVEDLERIFPQLMQQSPQHDSPSQQQHAHHGTSSFAYTNAKETPIIHDCWPENERTMGNDRATTISTITCKSGNSRIVVALLKERQEFQLKIQEMKPDILDIGKNPQDAVVVRNEHQKLIRNLKAQNETPVDNLMRQYEKIMKSEAGHNENNEIYGFMAENLQCCWQALLNQLQHRANLLDDAIRFYETTDELSHLCHLGEQEVDSIIPAAIDAIKDHREMIEQKLSRLNQINSSIVRTYDLALEYKQRLVNSIEQISATNLGDSRHRRLERHARALIDYIEAYLNPLKVRRQQFDLIYRSKRQLLTNVSANARSFVDRSNVREYSTMFTATDTTTTNKEDDEEEERRKYEEFNRLKIISAMGPKSVHDLEQLEAWLQKKINQLNSPQLASLGLTAPSTRSILDKHQQILLECQEIYASAQKLPTNAATATRDNRFCDDNGLLNRQEAFVTLVKNTIANIKLRNNWLQKTHDFYLNAKEAMTDIQTLLTRLEIDHSLQSVQWANDELAMKDVSSIVASGATILSEISQLQQQQQQQSSTRSNLDINHNMITNGVRCVIDQLNQHHLRLKQQIGERRHALLNEDTDKISRSFIAQCHYLHTWLRDHLGAELLKHQSMGVNQVQIKQYCDKHQELQNTVQNKTLDVEALLRSFPTLVKQVKINSAAIQAATDELRQDWIELNNCLVRRLELAKKYLNVHQTVARLEKDFAYIESRINSGSTRSQLDRPEEDIVQTINQTSLQLTNTARNFIFDAERSLKETVVKDARQTYDFDVRTAIDTVKDLVNGFNQKKQDLMNQYERMLHETNEQELRPQFKRSLPAQIVAKPNSTVELECETSIVCPIEWSKDDDQPIPANIDHKIVAQGKRHKLVINNFTPNCCGVYSAKSSQDNHDAPIVTSARIELDTIQPATTINRIETINNSQTSTVSTNVTRHKTLAQHQQQQQVPEIRGPRAWTPESSTSTASQWRSVQTSNRNDQASDNSVGGAHSNQLSPHTYYDGGRRSPSKSPFEGPSQAPKFVQPLHDITVPGDGKAELVCTVVSNPAPTIEWFHGGKKIAETKNMKLSCWPKGGACKLTIDHIGQRTYGEYLCRASNRFGCCETSYRIDAYRR
ncbi:Muscle M-line assembly protein unc-89, partial [Fragariocoptes setiger]